MADTLKALRKRASMSQEELAVLAGLDRTYVSSVERRHRNLTLDSLERLLHGLGVRADDFLEETVRRIRDGQED